MKKIIYLLTFASVLFGCESTVSPELNDAERIIVVDAWVDQKMKRQEIRIVRSQPYFQNTHLEKISGAAVEITDLNSGERYAFTEGESSYYWDPATQPFGVVGHEYRLTVTLEGETFEAFSKLGRVPPIDSIEFSYNEKDLIIPKEYFTAEFKAHEPAGIGDTYWIKAWKNGQHLNKPGEMNMTYDASFTPGQSVDGQQFVIPIRKDFINPLDKNPDKESQFLPPYLVGDSVYVEIHSIDLAAYEFLFATYFHTTRPGGFVEMFSQPLANTPTNIQSTNRNSTTGIAGFFNTAAVSGKGQRLTQEIADQAKSKN